MKVIVSVTTTSNAGESARLSLAVRAAETVANVKDRVVAAQLIPFPDLDLKLNGEVLEDGLKLGDCGVKEGSSLDLVVKASAATLVGQLSELLQARDLSCDELGLLYCYKHGASISQALETVGHEGKLQAFLDGRKAFTFEGGRVSLAHRSEAEGATATAKITETSVEARGDGGSSLEDDAEAAVRPYVDLHDRISGRAFHAASVQALSLVVATVQGVAAGIFNVDHVVRGGSVGKGTAIEGAADAQIVVFLAGLPPALSHERWLQPLLRTFAGLLVDRMCAEWDVAVENVEVAADSLRLHARGLSTVEVRFSPVFGSYLDAIQALRTRGAAARHVFEASLAGERVQFVARQAGQVKVTIRLMKWWRDQQSWSSRTTRPTDDILELVAVYAAVSAAKQVQQQTASPQSNQRAAIDRVMNLLARFNELRIIWSNYYKKEDIWSPLLSQRPLLMDPVNPFVNVADPDIFDARELMTTAQSSPFFR